MAGKNKVYIDVVIDDKGTTKKVAVSAKALGNQLDDVNTQANMEDLSLLNKDDASEETVVLQTDDEKNLEKDAESSLEDLDATVAYVDADSTEQFDPSGVDTEFLDPAENTVAQNATDLHELGSPSLIEEVGTKLDLAKAFVDMGDSDAAKETLLEVINEGEESQIRAAKDLMSKLGS